MTVFFGTVGDFWRPAMVHLNPACSRVASAILNGSFFTFGTVTSDGFDESRFVARTTSAVTNAARMTPSRTQAIHRRDRPVVSVVVAGRTDVGRAARSITSVRPTGRT